MNLLGVAVSLCVLAALGFCLYLALTRPDDTMKVWIRVPDDEQADPFV